VLSMSGQRMAMCENDGLSRGSYACRGTCKNDREVMAGRIGDLR
jgi:hypothetical protein